MKKIIQLFAALIVLVTFYSCKKYLDIEPVGKVIPTTPADFRALLTTAYTGFPEHKSLLSVRTDELLLDEYGFDYPLLRDIAKYNDSSPDVVTSEFQYVSFYKSIFYANEVIMNLDERAGKTPETDQLKGEAYLIRAYCHFELLNLYAKPYNKATASTDRGIVLSLKTDLEQNYKPAMVEEVYAQVLSDITEGQKLLNITTFEAGKNYRFSKRAAWALAARVYEFKGDWTNSLASVQQALTLNNALEDLNAIGAVVPNSYLSKESVMNMEKVNNALVNNTSYISEHLLNIYDRTNDLRFGLYFSKSGGDYVSLKGNSDALKISFRNGELYLIQAEAALQSGNLSLALQVLLDLKVKRLKPEYFATEKIRVSALTSATLLLEIIAERERELALEGHRWYDLRRYGQPAIIHSLGGEDFTLQKNDPRYTLRFPKSAIANNPNLQ